MFVPFPPLYFGIVGDHGSRVATARARACPPRLPALVERATSRAVTHLHMATCRYGLPPPPFLRTAYPCHAPVPHRYRDDIYHTFHGTYAAGAHVGVAPQPGRYLQHTTPLPLRCLQRAYAFLRVCDLVVRCFGLTRYDSGCGFARRYPHPLYLFVRGCFVPPTRSFGSCVVQPQFIPYPTYSWTAFPTFGVTCHSSSVHYTPPMPSHFYLCDSFPDHTPIYPLTFPTPHCVPVVGVPCGSVWFFTTPHYNHYVSRFLPLLQPFCDTARLNCPLQPFTNSTPFTVVCIPTFMVLLLWRATRTLLPQVQHAPAYTTRAPSYYYHYGLPLRGCLHTRHAAAPAHPHTCIAHRAATRTAGTALRLLHALNYAVTIRFSPAYTTTPHAAPPAPAWFVCLAVRTVWLNVLPAFGLCFTR